MRASHTAAVTQTVEPRELVGPGFRQAPESEAYPFAGLFIRAAVNTICSPPRPRAGMPPSPRPARATTRW